MWKSILLTTLLAGTLDITAACLNAYLSAKLMPETVLRYVASGAFGKFAFTGDNSMILWGLCFHFIIALSCTVCYFLAYSHLSFLHQNLLLSSVLIGVVAWIVTNLGIIPMSQIVPRPFDLSKALIAAAILVVCIGLPIAYNAHKFYNAQNVEK